MCEVFCPYHLRAIPRVLYKRAAEGLQEELLRHLKEDSQVELVDFGVQLLDTVG